MRPAMMAVLLVCIISTGCSGFDAQISAPDPIEQAKTSENLNNHALLGLWQGCIDPDAETIDLVELRVADFHLNVLPFLEPPALLNMSLDNLIIDGEFITVDIGLRHPFPGLTEFTGFDVCGIFISNGSATGFNDTNLVMTGEGDTRLLNPDGYSRWWNPVEFPQYGTVFSYVDGLLGVPDSEANFNCTLNGYKYFCDDLNGINDTLDDVTIEGRGMFSAGQMNTRRYELQLGGDGLIFNYAVDACWQQPLGDGPWTAPDDFASGANRAEAWRVVVNEMTNELYYDELTSNAGGHLRLSIDVYDHFNSDLNQISCESLAGLPYTSSSTPIGGGDGYSTYDLDIPGDWLMENGTAMMLITVRSEEAGYGETLPGEYQSSYFMHSFEISDEEPIPQVGWGATWGGTGREWNESVDADSFGNTYSTGEWRSPVLDFDPGPGIDNHYLNGSTDTNDIYILKLDADGNYVWALTYGGTSLDWNKNLCIDNSGYIYACGGFRGTTDFDPGTGTEYRTEAGGGDAQLCKFAFDGTFQWVISYGGPYFEEINDVGVDSSGNIFVVGDFRLGCDFDPGSGTMIIPNAGSSDIYLAKFDSTGNLMWVRGWGGIDSDQGRYLALDSTGNVYVTGDFNQTVDFDPGPGVDSHTSAGYLDSFLSKFDTDGNLLWARTWGGPFYDQSWTVCFDGTDIYVTGGYYYTVDFDPGSGTVNHTSEGLDDVYVSKFSTTGNLIWTAVWGGTGSDHGCGIDTDATGNVYVTGNFQNAVDMDPGAGTDMFTSNGDDDAFVVKLNSSGVYQWGRTTGGTEREEVRDSCVDSFGNVFTAAYFRNTMDIDPGPAVDNRNSAGDQDSFTLKLLPNGYWE